MSPSTLLLYLGHSKAKTVYCMIGSKLLVKHNGESKCVVFAKWWSLHR